jgi:AcrR family transcriptional regulator
MAKITISRNGSKKDTIINKAAALFRKKGFTGTSMRELAESIGVEASSLYNHIGSKSELLQSICFKVANDFTIHLNNVEQQPSSAAVRLKELIRFHIHMMLDEYDKVFVANHEWKQLDEPYLSNFLNQRKLYENRLTEIVQLGVRKKEFRNVHPYITVLTILSAVRGLEFWHHNKKKISAEELEKSMTEHLLNGIIK